MQRRTLAVWLACVAVAATTTLTPAAPAHAQRSYTSAQAQAPFTQQELDQMLAPIALYPDPLLAQVLMAATRPRDVVEAERFVRQNPGASGDDLADAVERMPWDPGVQALTQFPSVLAMMSDRLEWTERLGDAFVAQREQVMDTVQALRARARAAGTLQSTEHQQVVVRSQVIVIEPVHAGLLWVPYYDPLLVFGAWWWPDYRPFFWVPPLAYRPPRFAEVYVSGFVRGPYVPVRPRLWHDPRPVWRDRYVVVDNRRVNNVIVTRPGTRRPTVWRYDPRPDHDLHPRRPPPPRAAPALPSPRLEAPRNGRDFRGGRNNSRDGRDDRDRRSGYDPRGGASATPAPRLEPRPQARPQSVPRRIEKPVPLPRLERPAPRAQPPGPRGEAPHPRHAPRLREPGQRGPQ